KSHARIKGFNQYDLTLVRRPPLVGAHVVLRDLQSFLDVGQRDPVCRGHRTPPSAMRTARLQRHMWWSAWTRAYVCAPMREYRCACASSTKAALSSSMARLPDRRPKCASRSAALRERAGLWVSVQSL